MKNLFTINQLRLELKNNGYRLKIKTYSEFKSAEIIASNNLVLPSIFTKGNLKEWKIALDIKEKYKGKIFDNGYPVIL